MSRNASKLAYSAQTIDASDDLDGIVDGLSRDEKTISPKYFYDERGSQLFDEITQLPEYYPTETELGIMRDNIDEIADLVGEQASLIEFGAGSSVKIRILLDHLKSLAAYVPVDISDEHLLAAAEQLKADYPGIEILPIAADFTQPFDLPTPTVMPVRNVVYFPGSTIGNFTRDAALDLLQVMHHEAKENGALLIGVDLQKDVEILERAYNDSRGVTAEFNLNMLRHINREYGANFDLDAFAHRAEYNAEEGRIELRLDSSTAQTIELGDSVVEIAKGEAILTEYSHKYTLEGFAELAAAAGFEVQKVWTDADELFSVQYCRRV
ncbi:MAG: L-histidine N(alpha)-methyltransferase [Pseudomonadota bacterium]